MRQGSQDCCSNNCNRSLYTQPKSNSIKMSIAEKTIKVIQERYDSSEYKAGIESITTPEQKIYGAVDKKHTSAVLFWVKELWENTPEALMIAAAGHDWGRTFENERDRLEDYPSINGKPVPEWYDAHKAMHSANTARILKRELSNIMPPDMMLDVTYLVLHHEIGGRKDSNDSLLDLPDKATNSYNLNKAADVLQQADSLAFFNILSSSS